MGPSSDVFASLPTDYLIADRCMYIARWAHRATCVHHCRLAVSWLIDVCLSQDGPIERRVCISANRLAVSWLIDVCILQDGPIERRVCISADRLAVSWLIDVCILQDGPSSDVCASLPTGCLMVDRCMYIARWAHRATCLHHCRPTGCLIADRCMYIARWPIERRVCITADRLAVS